MDLRIGLEVNWVKLLYKRLRKIQSKRKDEFLRFTDLAGGTNPLQLARLYVEPEVQLKNPADYPDENAPTTADRKSFRKQINAFLEREVTEKSGRHVLFLLAGAGMGKTTALIMLHMSQYRDFWPTGVKFELLKLGEETLDEVTGIDDKPNTVLLLDSLDEDPSAYDDVGKRLIALLDATTSFRQVVLTCRTQFFPDPDEKPGQPCEQWAQIEVGGYQCCLFYLAPFSKEQARAYLRRKFPLFGWERIKSQLTFRGKLDQRAIDLVESMGSLTMRPLMLAYIEDLLSSGVDPRNPTEIYESLIGAWIRREVRKLRKRLGKEVAPKDLRRICEELAGYLHANNLRTLTKNELAENISKEALETLTPLDIGGRTLLNRTSSGSYQFAHKTVQDYLALYFMRCVGPKDKLGNLNEVQVAFCSSLTERQLGARLGLKVQRSSKGPRGLLLAGIDLPGFDLRCANLTGADLSMANLTGANLSLVDLTGANLSVANLTKANLVGAKLARANFSGANLTEACLGDVFLTGAKLDDADLTGANLDGARLNEAVLNGARLCGASLSGVDLTEAYARETNLSVANLTGASLNGAYLERSKLSHADLNAADLTRADLTGANLRGAELKEAELRGADLTRADLTEADLTRADLTGADLTGADLTRADLTEVDLTGVDLTRVDLTKTNLTRTRLDEENVQDDSIIGFWVRIKGYGLGVESYRFREDGTVTAQVGNNRAKGRWLKNAEGQYVVEPVGSDSVFTAKGEVIEVHDCEGLVARYQRSSLRD